MKMDIYGHAAILHFMKSIPFCKIPDWSFTITTYKACTLTGTKLQLLVPLEAEKAFYCGSFERTDHVVHGCGCSCSIICEANTAL